MAKAQSRIVAVLTKNEDELLAEWMKQLEAGGSSQDSRISPTELRAQCKEFLSLVQRAAQSSDSHDLTRGDWKAVGEFLETVSRSRIAQGFTSDQTAQFVFSLKRPIFRPNFRKTRTRWSRSCG